MLKITAPILASLNEAETVAFYQDKLGFTFRSSWDGYLVFTRDEVSIHLWPCDNAEIPKNTGCYINVNEVEKLYAEYLPQGIIHPDGPLTEMPWGMKQFSVTDNNGNLIHFGEPLPGNED